MGSGKTHWGKLLAAELKLPFFDLDTVISDAEKKSVFEIFQEKGEEYFRYREKEMLEELVNDHTDFVLSCGGGTPCFFNSIGFMKKNGMVVWLNTSVGLLHQRLFRERMSRPLLMAISESGLKNYIIRKLGERRMYYEQADLSVHEDGIELEKLITLIREHE
jgi:shikimate kinase